MLGSTAHADAKGNRLLAGLERESAAAAVLFAVPTVIALPHRKVTL
ncbi:hypothetical protein L083_2635 [Actinoplanes sp. N902-109]|nr:hypothetical protein L083_2635 [Actinoplanes sp. N902-109]